MKITLLELSGFLWTKFSGINYIKITPEHPLILVLGSNGSGKTSLVKQWTPLPAHHSDFEQGGFKYIELLHRNKQYKLRNTFDKGTGTFSFIEDGVELLNEKVNSASFKQLVIEKFGLTDQVNDFISGNTTFSRMSVAERRSLIPLLGSADYTYALNYFKELSIATRDIEGSLKRAKKRLTMEEVKLVSPEEEKLIRDRISSLDRLIEELLKAQSNVEDFSTLSERLLGIEEELNNVYRELQNTKLIYPGYKVEVPDIAEKESTMLIKIKSDKLKELYGLVEELNKQYKAYEENAIDSIKDINNKLNTHQEVLEELYYRKVYKDVQDKAMLFKKPIEALEALNNMSHTLLESYSVIESITSVYSISPLVIKENTKRLTIVDNKLKEHISETTRIETLLAKMAEDKQHILTCKKCGHTSHLHYDEILYNELSNKLNTNTAEIEELSNEKDKLNTYIDKYEEYKRAFLTIKSLRDGTNNYLEAYWKVIIDSNALTEDSHRLFNIHQDLLSDIKVDIEIGKTLDKISELKELKKAFDMGSLSNKEEVMKLREKYELEIHDLLQGISKEKMFLSRLESYKKTKTYIDNIKYRMKFLLENKDKTFKERLISLEQQYMDSVLKATRSERTDLNIQLSHQINIQNLVNNLKEQIAEEEKDVHLLKLSIKALSPKEGLIAQGLIGYINHFFSGVNEFISKIWSYSMNILPIEMDDDNVDLDYKFPVQVDKLKPAPDISSTSKGMREFIDLAIRINGMVSMGFEDFPIILDEFGDALDSYHKGEATKAILSLIDNTNFSQFIMISHAEISYGALRNADLIVLHADNISMPIGVEPNKNVVIM